MPAEEAIEQWVDTEDLIDEYIGFGFMVKKEFEYTEDNTTRTLNLTQKHWFWSTIKLSAGVYKDVLYALDDAQREEIVASFKGKKRKPKINIQRFKQIEGRKKEE